MTKHLRIFRPHRGVLAFYDGRIPGYRFAAGDNWVDDGALSLGIASYALVDGSEALVYDTHVSPEYGALIRREVESLGATRITVVLSHWHLDHVAGTAAFADCRIIANAATAAHLSRRKAAIEAGAESGPPAISPLLLPTETFSGQARLHIGNLRVELIEANIHSDDATVLWLPSQRLLLAGDTMEDTVTYVGEPEHFAAHLADLERLWALDPAKILPNHGAPEVIAEGGYDKSLIRATQQYIRLLQRCAGDAALRETPFAELIAGPLQAGWLRWFQPYEDIHLQNLVCVMAHAKAGLAAK